MSRWRALRRVALAAAALLLAAGSGGVHAQDLKFPALSGRVVDDAHVLPDATKAELDGALKGLQEANARQLVVVTLPSLQGDSIEDYGYRLGRAWGVGQKGIDNGALFIVAPAEHKVRIEVGYGMEGVLTDALTSVILQTQVIPRFKAGDTPGGIVAGTQALVAQMRADPSTAEQALANAQARQAASRAEAQGGGPRGLGGPGAFILVILVVFWIVPLLLGRGRGGGFGAALPFLFLGGLGGGGGGRSDDDEGGGFSGGGGSFGGGGSSGSW